MIDLGRTHKSGVNHHELFVVELQIPEGGNQKVPHAVSFSRGYHIVVGLVGLKHHPHSPSVVAGITPVALGIQVAQGKLLLKADFDPSCCTGDLSRHEVFATTRAFVIE